MKMKFRTYVIAALATTALVPLIAWSLLQWSDIRSSLAKDDWEQRFFTGIGSAFLVERMKSVDVFAAHVESETAKRLRAGVTCASLEGFLAELAAANPYIKSLKCTGADTPVEPDLVVLDLMMPVKDGHETLAELRTFSKVPVMILTARDLLQDKTKSFNTGADDYLVKPFAFAELEVRIRALLRRASGSDMRVSKVVANGPLELRTAEHDLFWRGRSVPLTEQEFRILSALAKHPGAVIRYAELLRQGRGDGEVDVARLRVAVARIRKKLSANGINPMIISSFTNVGYLMGDLTNYDEDFGL